MFDRFLCGGIKTMPEIIKCNFNLFDEGRKYSGHHRNYLLESTIKTCYAPATREGLRQRELFGYLGHGRRQIAGKMRLGEVEAVKLPDGSTLIMENVPSNVTVFFEIAKDGNVEHHQEIIESDPGRVVLGLNRSRVGGFSWAARGVDGGPLGATRMNGFEGFDYVMNPGFSANRGYILEDAETATQEMILESICKLGVAEPDAEKFLRHWVASAQVRALELEEQLEQAAIYEDSLREEMEKHSQKIAELESAVTAGQSLAEARRQIILESAARSVIVVPENVVEAMISMANEQDFHTMVGFFESAGKVDLSRYPLPGQNNQTESLAKQLSPLKPEPPEYGTAAAGYDFEEKEIFGS
jgi:hypothetical protein